MSSLKAQISLLTSKYENIKDDNELIYLLKKEFNKEYNKQDLLNLYIDLTNLEIENNIINYYGDLYKHAISD